MQVRIRGLHNGRRQPPPESCQNPVIASRGCLEKFSQNRFAGAPSQVLPQYNAQKSEKGKG